MLSTVPRRLVEAGSLLVAVVALGFVLVNATLVDRRPPSVGRVSLSAAADGDRLAQTLTAIDIEFSEPVQSGSVERRFRISPFVPGSFAWEGDTTLTFTPAEKLPGDTEFAVTVEPGFEDRAGNAAPTGLEAWTFRTVGPPTILGADPGGASDGVPVDAAVALTFDRLMDTESVARAVRIEPAATYRLSWSGPVLTVAFDPALAFGTEYRLTVGTDAADTDGSHLRDVYETTFRTVAAGLDAETIVPAPNVAGVSVRSPVAVVFDAAVDPSSIEGALRITPPVPGELSVAGLPDDRTPPAAVPSAAQQPDLAGRVLLFTPAEPLAPHTTYSVTLDPVVRRLGSSGVVAAGRTWSFTTSAPSTSVHNHVAFLSPRSGVLNVWVMNPDGSNPRQLTTELVPVAGYDISADGRTIAWSSAGIVEVADVDGSNVRQVTPASARDYRPVFTPDGRRLLVARRSAIGADAGHWLVPVPGVDDRDPIPVTATGAPSLGSVSLEGDGLLPDGGPVSWSRLATFDPAGRFLFLPNGLGEGATLVDLDATSGGTGILPLYARGPAAWSPRDGGFVVLATDEPDGRPGLFLVGLDRSVSRLADVGVAQAEPLGAPAVAADGRIAAPFDPDGDRTHHLAISPARSADLRALTSNPDFVDNWPAFSPDGAELLFVRVRPRVPTRSEGIWGVAPDGQDLRQLTTDGAYPRWIP